jgi:hypothetical protein
MISTKESSYHCVLFCHKIGSSSDAKAPNEKTESVMETLGNMYGMEKKTQCKVINKPTKKSSFKKKILRNSEGLNTIKLIEYRCVVHSLRYQTIASAIMVLMRPERL